jgi:hypothetical protein
VRERLERAERLVELLARLRVLDRDLERAVGAADRLRREQDDPLVQRCVPGVPARAGRTDPRRRGHAYLLEVHAVLAVGAERELLGERDARRVRIDQEEIDPVLRAGEHDHPVGRARELHVALGAGEDEVAALRTRIERDTDRDRSRGRARATRA